MTTYDPDNHAHRLQAISARLNIADDLELEESGQLRIGTEGEQRSFAGLAPALDPAPLNHVPERTAAELHEQRIADASEAHQRRRAELGHSAIIAGEHVKATVSRPKTTREES